MPMLVLQRATSPRLSSGMAAVAAFLGISAVLMVCLAAAVFNVVLRRESASVVQYQIQTLTQTSRQIVATILDHVDGCTPAPVVLMNSMAGIFPEARVSLRISTGERSRSSASTPG